MVLGSCRRGWCVRLREISSDARTRLRLVELGFVPGVTIHVIGRAHAGGLVVLVGDARVALDGRSGEALIVEPA